MVTQLIYYCYPSFASYLDENCGSTIIMVKNYYYFLFKIMLYYIPVNINQPHAVCGSIFQQKVK